MTELHVISDERSTWRVYETDAVEALSEHTSATDAELAARARAEDRAVERVIVHDRYHRTHDTAPSPAGVSAREQGPLALASLPAHAGADRISWIGEPDAALRELRRRRLAVGRSLSSWSGRGVEPNTALTGLVRHAISPRRLAGARSAADCAPTDDARTGRPVWLDARAMIADSARLDIGENHEESRGSRYGSVSVGTAEGTPREGALMVPVSCRSSTSSPDEPRLRPDSRVATLAAEGT
jgi:hypothetical protein